MAIKKSSGSGIPFGNNAGRPANPGTGQLYSNGEAQRLELYTAAGNWENIVQEVPGVSSISGTYSEQANSGTITIYGTNFVNGAYATAIGTNGVQINAASTTYNSLVQLTATFTGLSNANEPYDIKVTNQSNLFGLLPDALYVNASPVWQTTSGSLGTFNEQVSVSVSATATDSDSTISYALASGSTLPSGVSLNSATGLISGTLPNISSNTIYTFTINASDGLNIIPRTFSISSTAFGPVWSTSGTISPITNGVAYSYQLVSTDDGAVTYAINSGSLPTGITLSSSGLISGTTTSIVSSTGILSIVFRATGIGGRFTDQTLSIPTATYSFSNFTFTNAGVTGFNGPTLAQIRSAYSSESWTQSSSNLNMTVQGIQQWTVPQTGNYRITASGAGGGGTTSGVGAGALIQDTFALTSGEIINIVVGQTGGAVSGATGGGGGSYVVRAPYNTNSSILVIAGGGGGTEGSSSLQGSSNGQISTSGADGAPGANGTTGAGFGGSAGNGGGTASSENAGGGGAGFFTNGARNNNWNNNGGVAFVNGATGASASGSQCFGGFGGGGAASGNGGGGGAAGGGGYSGGGGGDNAGNTVGGGGGSYFANGLNINRVTTSGGGAGGNTAGYVTILKL